MTETVQESLGAYGADPPSKVVRDLRRSAEHELRVRGRPTVEVADDA